MNNKGNIIVMFLFVMLSFAIISEVSAVSDAEADGTGFDPSVKSVNMTDHDIAGERIGDDRFMQDHDIDYMDDLKSHNEQNSFNGSLEPRDNNTENRNFYEHEMDGKNPLDFNFSDANKSMDIPKLPENKFNESFGLMDNNRPAVPGGEAAMNVTPNASRDDNGMMDNPKPAGNVSDQHGPDDKNKSPVLPGDIKKSQPKNIKAKNSKAKAVKKSKMPKKVKNGKAKAVKKSKMPKKVKNAKSKAVKKSKIAKQPMNSKPQSVKKVGDGKSKAVSESVNMNKSSIKGMAKL